MTWFGNQLPWNVKFSKPTNPSGQFEVLNWMKGPPILTRGGIEGLPSGPPVLHGIGHKPYYPNMITLRYLYNPSVLPGMSSLIRALRIKGP
jgi:hypothetical protein